MVNLKDVKYCDRPERAAICVEFLGSPDDPTCAVWIDDGMVPFIRSSQEIRDAIVEAVRQELQRRSIGENWGRETLSMGMQKGKAKQFHLGDILSVTHDRLVSPEHITGVYKIMEHLFQQPVFTHQLVILHGEAKRELFRQHPWLESPKVSHCYNLLDSDIEAHGPQRGVALLLERAEKTAKELTGAKRPYFDVQPIADAEQRDPISDLEGMVGKDKIVKVEIKAEGPRP